MKICQPISGLDTLPGEDEARLIALVCGPVPEGYAHWTLRLIRDRWVTLENTDTK
jgi:hypothetical protein